MSTKETLPTTCLICGKGVPDYVAQFCCSGTDCGCHGQPLDPCVCSQECYDAVIKGIGKPFEQRRADYITSLRTRLDAAEKELSAISAAVDVEYNGPNDKRSGDLLDDIGAFIDHHKAKEAELKQLKEANAGLVKDKERLDWCDRHPIPDFLQVGNDQGWTIRHAIDDAISKGTQ